MKCGRRLDRDGAKAHISLLFSHDYPGGALLLSLLLAFGVSARPIQRFAVTALVLSVDVPHGTVLVSHDKIPGYMDAMTMPYRVDNPRVLDSLKRGARIEFTLVVGKSSSYISNVQVCEFGSHECDPDQTRRP